MVVVSLDGKHPVWYPDTWIWGDLERFGIDGLASVIEARIRETGGEIHPVSLSDRLAAEERRLTFESKRRTWRHQDSPQDAQREFERLKDVCRRRIEDLNPANNLIKITQFNFGKESSLDLGDLHLGFRCEPTFANLKGTILGVWIMKDGIPREDFVYGETKTLENVVEYQSDLDIDYPDIVGWREVAGQKRFFTSESLAELWLERLFAHGFPKDP